MSNARIIEIPATRQIRSGKNNTMRKMRVAAYCRVSTEEEEQQGSFETQKLYYTEKINSTSEWELAGIYADDGISGIHTKKRDGFNQMIQDCKKKKIDLILTKSISRFARNTLDSIQYVRMLKAIGIAVIFEKENINTSTMNSEMILTVLSAFAQAESESISQNVARGKRMGFRQGKFPFPYGQILGYRKGLDGKPEVIPEEAEVIRMIFNSYLQGASLLTIKKKLEAGGVLTARGNKKWSSESVQRILQNEKYCGDVLLQKTFIEDVLTGVSKKNTGQLPQYYIENNHEGIVTKQMFREVQAEIARRNSLSAILAEIAGANGMGYFFDTPNDPFYDRVEQSKTSDITFLQRLCTNAGLNIKATKGKLVIYDQSDYEQRPVVIEADYRDTSFTKWKLETKTADTKYASCRVSYVEPATGACIEYTAYTEDYDEDAKTNQQLELYAKVGSVAEAKTMAEKHLRLHNKFSKTVQFTHTGHVWYVAGVGIRVKGYGFWDGRYICTQAKHTINENGFTTTVTGRRILEGY